MLPIFKLAHILDQQEDGIRANWLQDRGFRTPRLEEAVASPEAETFREVSRFVAKSAVRIAARYNPYTAAAVYAYHVYDTVDEWILSALPEWATDPWDLK